MITKSVILSYKLSHWLIKDDIKFVKKILRKLKSKIKKK